MISRKVIRADNFSDVNSIILITAMMYDGDLLWVRKPWCHPSRPRPLCAIWSEPEAVTSPAEAYTAATACFMYTRRRCDMRGLKYDTALRATSPLYRVCAAYRTILPFNLSYTLVLSFKPPPHYKPPPTQALPCLLTCVLFFSVRQPILRSSF